MSTGNTYSDPETNNKANSDDQDSSGINEALFTALSVLFGEETTRQASLIDVADLCMNDEMLESITAGVKKLKELRSNPSAQVNYIKSLDTGARLVLCMWIMDMNLLEKIQSSSRQPYNK